MAMAEFMFEKITCFLISLKRLKLSARKASMTRPTKLGVLAIMKNEAMNIDEWIEHYLWMGAGKIYLIDNGSTDDTVSKARAWQAKGLVQLVEYTEKHKQRQHYWRAIKHFQIRQQCEWLLVADLDEFWFCPNGDRMTTALCEFESYDVIYSNWVMFGSSGLVEQPKSAREGFLLRRPGTDAHLNTKYICRTSVLKRASSVHIHKIKGADSSRTISDIQRFQLNHYPIQSLEFFRSVKMTRGAADSSEYDNFRDIGYFRRYDDGCTEIDRKLADLVLASQRQ